MRRNLILLAFLAVSILLVVNSTKRLLAFKTTAQKVEESEQYLAKLKEENEALKAELEYKRSQEFIEGEIRNKLGLAKEGEAVVVLPNNDSEESTPLRQGSAGQAVDSSQFKTLPNYIKWWELFFGT